MNSEIQLYKSMNQTELKEILFKLDLSELEKLRKQAEVEKLNLEIRELSARTKVRERLLQYIPLITVSIAVAAFLFGIYQFTDEQRKQQDKQLAEQRRGLAIRIQDQIQADLDQLLHFTTEEQTVSRALFLLEDLKFLVGLSLNVSQDGSDVLPCEERVITQSLVGLIDNDCDFIKNEKDVHFTATVIDHWKDYSDYLKQNADVLNEVLAKYDTALVALHAQDPRYFQTMQFDPEQGFKWPYEDKDQKWNQYQKFIGLKYGFQMHLAMLGKDAASKDTHIKAFQTALRNAKLTQQLLGKSF